MNHFIYLFAFAALVSVMFGVVSSGSPREKAWQGIKVFGQFVGFSLVMSWLFYFLPW